MVKMDGAPFWVRLEATVAQDADGETVSRVVLSDITETKKAQEELQKMLNDVKTLRGIVPICSNCKKIRDDKGYWSQVDDYVEEHSEATFTHGLCPDCLQTLYPNQQ